jgi:DNA repair photolyase
LAQQFEGIYGIGATGAEQNSKLSVNIVKCSSLLHRLNYGSSTEYTANFYKGCSHGCVYCYAPSLVHDDRSWGRYVDAKINAPSVLHRELRSAEKDVVFVSSASDPYQPVEARYKLTRRCLEVLRRHDFPVLILTRSPLVLRDLDIILKLNWVRVGFSISSVSDKFYEPGVPSVEKRVETLQKLSDAGVKTWVSLAPVIPKILLTNFDWLFSELAKARVSGVSLGTLRFIGYEKSKEMFEERTGLKSRNVMADSMQVQAQLTKLAEQYGLDTTCSELTWKNQDNNKITNLDWWS